MKINVWAFLLIVMLVVSCALVPFKVSRVLTSPNNSRSCYFFRLEGDTYARCEDGTMWLVTQVENWEVPSD